MVEMTHEDIERIWKSIIHYFPERSKLDGSIDFVKTLDDMGIEEDEIKASAEYDPKLEEAINTVYDEQEEEDNNVDIERYEDH